MDNVKSRSPHLGQIVRLDFIYAKRKYRFAVFVIATIFTDHNRIRGLGRVEQEKRSPPTIARHIYGNNTFHRQTLRPSVLRRLKLIFKRPIAICTREYALDAAKRQAGPLFQRIFDLHGKTILSRHDPCRRIENKRRQTVAVSRSRLAKAPRLTILHSGGAYLPVPDAWGERTLHLKMCESTHVVFYHAIACKFRVLGKSKNVVGDAHAAPPCEFRRVVRDFRIILRGTFRYRLVDLLEGKVIKPCLARAAQTEIYRSAGSRRRRTQ